MLFVRLGGYHSSWVTGVFTELRETRMKCLIVEDNVVLRLDYVLALEQRGYECVETDSVEDALYLLKTHVFSVILLDLQVSDGIALPVADYVQVMGLETAVVLVTGTGAFPYGETTRLSPRIDYVLRKPLQLSDLAAVVDYLAA